MFDDTLRQGLIVQLQQSPYLHVLPDQNVRRVLGMMGHPPDTRLAAKRALQRAERTEPRALVVGYYIAMFEQDAAEMERLAARIEASSEPHLLRHAQSLSAARVGQLRHARALAQQAVDAAAARDQREVAATYESAVAVWEALSGNESAARQRAASALKMSSERDIRYASAFALAIAGDLAKSESLANDLDREYPRDTLVRFTYVPTLRALAARARNQPATAIELLQVTSRTSGLSLRTPSTSSSAACTRCTSVATRMPRRSCGSRPRRSFRRSSIIPG